MARKAVAKATVVTRDTYEGDENLRLALTHLVQVIGEAGRHVSRECRDEHPEIPWQEVVGMRHKAVHDPVERAVTMAGRWQKPSRKCRS
ncbi:MAG: DUF86 domain-containing protein [Acidobacteria bacterium]|nr:DUF86 domain-containing protein [Acidobacteriota bacterium]